MMFIKAKCRSIRHELQRILFVLCYPVSFLNSSKILPHMNIVLDPRKTVAQNAQIYFDKAKKAKKKIEGAEKAISIFRKQLSELHEQKEKAGKKQARKRRETKWFEKFRWFMTSEGFLVLCGRDATTNEIIVKKHTSEGDIVFHTLMAGSPFCVVKSEGRKIGSESISEAADAALTFSKGWKLGLLTAEVYYVNPEQLSKTPQAGEYVQKGAFIVRGKKNFVRNKISLAVGITDEGLVMAGPPSAVKKHCKKYVEVVQGREKTSGAAKKIQKKIGGEL